MLNRAPKSTLVLFLSVADAGTMTVESNGNVEGDGDKAYAAAMDTYERGKQDLAWLRK